MRNRISIAALLLSGLVVVGCDNKDNSTVTPPATPNSTTTTPPAMPDTSKMSDAAKTQIDNAKTTADNMVDKAKSAMPSTMPSMPAMPK